MPFPPPEDIPNPGIKPTSPGSPALTSSFFFCFFFNTTEPPGKAYITEPPGKAYITLPTFYWPEVSHMVPLNHKGCSEMVLVVKNLPVNTEDTRDARPIPGPGRFPWRRAW